jgi:hypothetical protein
LAAVGVVAVVVVLPAARTAAFEGEAAAL